jgi:hypothetical protein
MTGRRISNEHLLGIPVKDPPERLESYPGPPPEPPSPDFAASYAIFEEAHRAYTVDKDYLRAADGFVRAAQAQKVRRGIHVYTADKNRSILYEDAAYAWLMAGVADAGRATLERLRSHGIATSDDVRNALAALDAR